MSKPKKPKFLRSKAPEAQGLKHRATTVTNAFAHSVLPVGSATNAEFEEAMRVLGQDLGDLRCVYCGAATHGWDHLRPTIKNKMPTGYITEVANHVPACGRCNSSKAGSDWRTWMLGNAPGSPTTRGVPDVAARVARLEAFERWRKPTFIRFEDVVDMEQWAAYWRLRDAMHAEMLRCQEIADRIRTEIKAALAERSAQDRAS